MSEILHVQNLKKYFPIHIGLGAKKAHVRAVDGVSLSIEAGEVLGLVGESGCGKSTLVNVLLNLEEPTSGKVYFEGKDVYALSKAANRELRKDMQIVFQDPFWSLNPRMLLKDIIGEPLKVHEKLKGEALIKRVQELMGRVGLPAEGVFQYPHEFSGGQRQRIAIARALAVTPKLVVLDEPTSAIDMLSQTQILELLLQLKRELGLTYILISHDLSVVHYMSDKICVMYLGEVVEYGDSDEIFSRPRHPYTQALFDAIPDINASRIEDIRTLKGALPSSINPPSGCRFHTRCIYTQELCRTESPKEVELDNGHVVRCHFCHKTGDHFPEPNADSDEESIGS